MKKLILTPARNGVIKKIIDNNYSGNNEKVTMIDVYESENNTDNYQFIKRFFYDLCEDLSLHIGNKFERNNLKLITEWGTHYEPSKSEIKKKIKELNAEINLLKESYEQ